MTELGSRRPADMLVIISPVLRALFRPDEIHGVSVVAQQGGDGAGNREVLLTVTAQGEVSRHYLWQEGQVEESPEELQDRLAGELEDFIAESRFAWGERRSWSR